MKRLLLLVILCLTTLPGWALVGPFYREIPPGCQVRQASPDSPAGPLYDERGFYMGYYQPLPLQQPSYSQSYVPSSNTRASFSPSLNSSGSSHNYGYSNYGNYGYSNYGNSYGGYSYGRSYIPRQNYSVRAISPSYSRPVCHTPSPTISHHSFSHSSVSHATSSHSGSSHCHSGGGGHRR